MDTFFLAVAILVMFLCGIGFTICMAMFADRLDDLMKGEHKDEDEQ